MTDPHYAQPSDLFGGTAGAPATAAAYPTADSGHTQHPDAAQQQLHGNNYQMAMGMRSPTPQGSAPKNASPEGHSASAAASSSSSALGNAARDQDRLLPIANIARIMKRAIPANGKVSKEAKACVQECVSEFIGFITSEASERLGEDKRKTITGDDVIESMRALGFDAYISFLQTYLMRYRESTKGGRAAPVKRGRKKGGEDGGDEDGDEDEDASSTAGATAASGSGAGGAGGAAGKASKKKKPKTAASAASAASTATATAAPATADSVALPVAVPVAAPSTSALNPPLPTLVQPPPLPMAGYAGGVGGAAAAYPQPHMHQQQIMQHMYGQPQR